jgi:hypothetical protein
MNQFDGKNKLVTKQIAMATFKYSLSALDSKSQANCLRPVERATPYARYRLVHARESIAAMPIDLKVE